jgi:hypothetical protein
VQWLSAKWATTAALLRWKEDRVTRRREYWRRAAAVNQGSGAAAAGEWEILPTEDEHLKALGFAADALCVGVLVANRSPAAAVAAAVPDSGGACEETVCLERSRYARRSCP